MKGLQLTQSLCSPILHHTAKTLHNLTRFNGSFLGLGLFVELGESHCRDLITAELSKKFLLRRQVEVFV